MFNKWHMSCHDKCCHALPFTGDMETINNSGINSIDKPHCYVNYNVNMSNCAQERANNNNNIYVFLMIIFV